MPHAHDTADVTIIGGGIIGLATAYRLLERWPRARLVLLEKERRLAAHQTGHNSGVLHSGIYYRPGSLRAVNCRQGKLAMEQFCAEHGVPHEICGKVIVATQEDQLPELAKIEERGRANGVACERIGSERLAELEPHAAGLAALHVPGAGIVDYTQVCDKLAQLIQRAGGRIRTAAKVRRVLRSGGELVIETAIGEFRSRWAINCAGLHCDRVTRASGDTPPTKIVPFRGEYYELKPAAHRLVKNLIYPTPDPGLPFLGVHFTRMIHGGVECGPNAVPALAREGYRWRDIDLVDIFDTLTYGGFHKMAGKYWRTGAAEIWRSLSKRAFVRALSRLVPEIRGQDLVAAPAGVRAQALGTDGDLVDDFVIEARDRMIHVGNAPSPAATSSLNIGRLIVEKLASGLPGGEIA